MDSTIYLGASLVALPLAPSLDWLARGVRWARPALDGFVLVMVGSLVLFHLLPHAMHEAGGLALLAGLAGVGVPMLIEALPGRVAQRGSRWVVGLTLLGLMLHVLLDGAALGTVEHQEHEHGSLALAVLVHRVPVSLFVWWAVVPKRGPVIGALVLAGIGLFTVAGYGLGAAATTVADSHQIALVEAFVGGALLHVLAGHGLGADPRSAPRRPVAETAGGLLAVGLLALVPAGLADGSSGLAGHRDVPQALLHLLLESAPALLIGYLLAGFVGTQLPHATIRWASRGGPVSRAARGVLFGLPIPICSCGVVPVYRGLVKAGLPASAGMAFLVATPELGVESVLLSFPLLGVELTVTRVLAAAAVALLAGVVVGRRIPTQARTTDAPSETSPALPWPSRLRHAAQFGLGEVLEQTGPWILAGLLLAALIDPRALGALTQALPAGAGVVLAAVAGLPLYVCASGATPLAAALLFGGLSPGAALAFLLSGPATNVTTFGVLAQLHGRRAAFGFGATVLLASVGVGLAIDAMWPTTWTAPNLAGAEPSLGPLNWIALAVLGAASLRLLLERGPQALLQTLYRRDGHEPAAEAEGEAAEPCCETEGCGG